MAIITVTKTADTGAGSLRAAIAAAQAGDTIQFASGLAGRQITLNSGEIRVTKNITLDGSAAPNLKISGNNASRIFSIEKYLNVAIKNLTFINGKAFGTGGIGEGGAVKVLDYGNLTVQNSTFRANQASRGGAIRVGYGGSLTVLGSTFDRNDGSSADDGFSAGAIATFGAGGSTGKGKLIVENSTFTNNKGSRGGAIYNLLGPVSIKNSVFTGNSSIRQGGAIFTDGASGSQKDAIGDKIIIEGSRFEGNSAVIGGGALYLWTYKADEVILRDSTIIGNTVTRGGPYNQGRGGGLEFAGSTLTIENTGIANNTAPGQGGGLWVNNNTTAVNITNSTISGNKAMDDAGGGMFLLTVDGRPVRITNTTLANNLAGRDAGALWIGGKSKDDVRVTNTLFVGNAATVTKQGDSNFTLTEGGGNMVQTVVGGKKTPLVTPNSRYVADAKLGGLQLIGNDMVHSLLTGSPAINGGVLNGAATTDQRGLTRDSSPDVGAFELLPTRRTSRTRTRTQRFSRNQDFQPAGRDRLTGQPLGGFEAKSSRVDRQQRLLDTQLAQDIDNSPAQFDADMLRIPAFAQVRLPNAWQSIRIGELWQDLDTNGGYLGSSSSHATTNRSFPNQPSTFKVGGQGDRTPSSLVSQSPQF